MHVCHSPWHRCVHRFWLLPKCGKSTYRPPPVFQDIYINILQVGEKCAIVNSLKLHRPDTLVFLAEDGVLAKRSNPWLGLAVFSFACAPSLELIAGSL
nr:MAG TPA: hypothetical protein [Caudoviricetes sp.]